MYWLKGVFLTLLFISATIATELECRLIPVKFRKGCSLKDLRVDAETAIVSIKTSGKHFKAMHIENEIALRFLPATLFKNFRDMEVLHVVNSQLREIKKATFENILKLEHINFDANELTELNDDTFTELKNLKSLNLDHNKLKYIHSRTFYENIALESLSLSFNQIDGIHENTLEKLTKLESLFLSNNLIIELRAKTFVTNFALEHIDLSGNKLQYISNNCFDPISSSLKRLNLENNTCITSNEKILNSEKSLDLTKLQYELNEHCLPLPEFECLNDLDQERYEKQHLKLEYSNQMADQTKACDKSLADTESRLNARIRQLEKELEEKGSTLKVENMKTVQLKSQKDELKDKFDKCEVERKNATTYLEMTVDKLINCDPSHENLPSLTEATELRKTIDELRSENANIKRLSGVRHQQLYFDIICDLATADTCRSHSVVVPFDEMLLSNARVSSTDGVTSLIISDSFMIFLPQDIFARFKRLSQLEIVNSKVRNLVRGTFRGAGNLQKLTILKNSIESLPNSAFEGANNVQFLKLDSNEIKSLSENTFADLDNLLELTLRNNEIVSISAKTFSNLAALRNLQLTNNKIEHLGANLLSRNIHLEFVTFNRNPIKSIDVHLLDNCSNLKQVYYGKTDCIRDNAKALDVETFRNDVKAKCSV